MSSPCPSRFGIASTLLAALLLAACGPRPLRVCADPNNLPFSNRAGEGFENGVARELAAELGRPLAYTWFPQRRGYVRNTVKAGLCDIWPGMASGVETLAVTRPYYRASYVFVTRADRNLHVSSFDDPRLRDLTVGVQMVGDDGANTPPAHALARRGLTTNVRGFMLFGDYGAPAPAAAIVEAVDRGDIDVAVVWGPTAGYFAQRAANPLRLAPVPAVDDGRPMAFDIGVGVRKGDTRLLHDLEGALAHRRQRIDALLRQAGVG